MIELNRLTPALDNARAALLAERDSHGHWEGRLSSSALSTAITVCALRHYHTAGACPRENETQLDALCEQGLKWLVEHQNEDGGWGDTTRSFSNISTTALCWGAFAGYDDLYPGAVGACETWLAARAGSLEPPQIARAIRARYGKDQTFSVPILTALALTGRLGEPREAWRLVPQLPFELAACPRSWFAALRLPVVSYALPALIAIGQVRHACRPTRNPLLRVVRNAARQRTLGVLEEIQPSSGGFLEATPLTSFVCLSLIGAGRSEHPVVAEGIRFLIDSALDDGSWAIDTNLATWVTTLSVRALATDPVALPIDSADRVRDWLLGQQYREVHPYTLAAPGAWAWTDLPGGVPDADDTPGAMLALKILDDRSTATSEAAAAAARWLVDLQNRDGGIPTFCRGWGTLPFDKSSTDLTAHALRAWGAWFDDLPAELRQRIEQARRAALRFLERQQRADGSWVPLWFGNQHASEEENPTYGTSRVLLALVSMTDGESSAMTQRGTDWLLNAQNVDGGWGGAARTPSSIEETALALEALAAVATQPCHSGPGRDQIDAAIQRGAQYLVEATDAGRTFPPSPIGFYFAKLWYYEKLYPLIYTVAALGSVVNHLRLREQHATATKGSSEPVIARQSP